MAAPRELELSEEVEGKKDDNNDFVFRLVGDPIPVLPATSPPLPLFNLHSPPARPLAVSDRHAAVFLAHPKGFIAARTKALIEASKEAREEGKASNRCAQDCCVVDVPLPGVSLLALSRDESVLAACAGSDIKFFSVTSLLTDKDVEPSSSCSLGQSGTVKDFKWLNHAYIVLSNGGLLYHGSLGEGLKDVMENVDAVDCCKDGNHIAVARKNSLRILSSDLKETCCMALLFQLWSVSDSEGTDIKVDSIGWVRDDSIVVGCVRLDEEGNEVGYLVQVIRSGCDTFFESSSKPVVFNYDYFGVIMDDILPSGVGPNLLLGYLQRWDLMVFSTKKNTDEHISLLKWPSTTDDERTVVYLEMVEDKYSPRIDLQENGDDNVILGFGVENVSLFQKITVLVGPEQKEIAPQHLLLCLTSEGKLIIYYLARISDPSDLPQTSLSTIDDSNVDKKNSPAIVSGKDWTPSVTNSVGKSLLTEPGAESSSAQAESDQHGSRDTKSSFPVAGNKDIVGSSFSISSDKNSLTTKPLNVASSFAPPSSSAPTSNMKSGMPFSFPTANNVGLNSTGSQGSSELVSSWQPNNSSSFVNSQLGKGGLDPAKPLGAFGGSQNATRSGGSLTFRSDGSVPVKTAERNEATGFGSYPAQTSYTNERKVIGSSPGFSSAPSLPISPNKPLGSDLTPTVRSSLGKTPFTEPFVYVQAKYPPVGPPPEFHEMEIVMSADPRNPFPEDIMKKLRDWFARHEHQEEIMGDDYEGPLKHLGPNHLMERQTTVFAPRRWLRLKVLLDDSKDTDWIGLVLRGDNAYTKGFYNIFGQYQIPESKSKSEEDKWSKVNDLPTKDYVILEDDWDFNYSAFLNCDQTVLQGAMRALLESEDFMATTISYLAKLNPLTELDNREGKRRLGGLVFRLCEFMRMNLDMEDPRLLEKVQNWFPICRDLRMWKASDYKCWTPSSKVKKMEIKSAEQGLICKLVLNVKEQFPQKFPSSTEGLKGIRVDGETGEKDHKDEKGPTLKKSSVGNKSSSGGNVQSEDRNIAGGEERMQLLGVEASFNIEAINIYDSYRGQRVLRRKGDAELIVGPSKAISAEDVVGAEIYYHVAGQQELKSLRVEWNLYDQEEGLKSLICHKSPAEEVQLLCLLIKNALEAVVDVRLRLGGKASKEIAVSVKASSTCYGGRSVTLLAQQNMDVCGEWTTLTLDAPVLCLPFDNESDLVIDVDLQISNPYSNIETLSLKLSSGSRKVCNKFGDYECQIDLRMHPDPLHEIDEDVQMVAAEEEKTKSHLNVKPRLNPAASHEDVQMVAAEKEKTKRHLNVVFIGPVDAGKSTIGGQILFLSGQVDDRTKYEKEAKDKSRESWYIMDTNEKERQKGKTVEVGIAYFETENTRFTILDPLGHKSCVPNMISAASSQADIGVLVISARKGEFETEKAHEHALLANTLGVAKLIVVINKMDEPTVQWSKRRYDEIEGKMVPFLRASGYNVKKDVQFLPISGFYGANMKTRMDKSICSWWDGPCLLEVLDRIKVPLRDPKGPVRMPIMNKFDDMGTVLMGTLESGTIREGDSLLVMPIKSNVKVIGISLDEKKVWQTGPGENIRVKLSGIKEDDIMAGFVLSSVANSVGAYTEFNAQLQILELLDKAVLTVGYKAVLHIHSVVEKCEIVDLIEEIDMKKMNETDSSKKKKQKRKPLFVKNGAVVVCRIQVYNLICIEQFADVPQLGRFTVRKEGKTVAVGKVVAVPPIGRTMFL